MKIIHTSDWHLGQNFYGYDRTAEHAHFLRQLAQIVSREQPHALLVCGDVFDTMQPSAQAAKLFADGLIAIHDACPGMRIIVTAGNHDSPSRISADSALWQRMGVTIVGDVEWEGDTVLADRHIITVSDVHGRPEGQVVALPFLRGNRFVLPDVPEPIDSTVLLQALTERAAARQSALPVVVMAHTAVRGNLAVADDDATAIGNIDYVPLGELRGEYDYLALGHIHHPHTLAGSRSRARYCGSPMALSFDEDYEHSVSIVNLDGHHEPSIITQKIEPLMALSTLPMQPAPLDEAMRQLHDLPHTQPAYIRLNVLADGFLPGDARQRAAEVLDGSLLRFCEIRKTSAAPANTQTDAVSLEDFKQMSPLDVATRYFTAMGTPLDEEHAALLKQVIQQHQTQEQP